MDGNQAMSFAESERLKADINRCKERIAQIERGERGVHNGPFLDTDGNNPGAGLAHSAQLQAQRDALLRLQRELLTIVLLKRDPGEVLERLSMQRISAEPTVQMVRVDTTRAALVELLASSRDAFVPRSKLQELIT